MNVSDEFTTAAPPAVLTHLSTTQRWLASVPTLRDVEVEGDTVRALFTPTTPLGRVPLATTIVTEHSDLAGTRLRVRGRRGAQAVDVELRLRFAATDSDTVVTWSADLRLAGAGASVGQRVAADLARRVIGEVLESAAASAEAGVA